MRHRYLFTALVASALVLGPSGGALLRAQQQAGEDELPDVDAVEMEEVVVTATRTRARVLEVPQHVSVITGEDIRDSGAKNLADVLNARAGSGVSGYGPQGQQQSASLRGSTIEQVLVLVDGVRLNDAMSGDVDLSLVPIENIERIEIVRGGMSALYGADAVGGVINIVTRKEAEEDHTVLVRVENGSYIPVEHVAGFGLNKQTNDPDYAGLVDTQKVSARLSHDFGGVVLNTAGSFVHARNGYVFKDVNDQDRKRENADLIGGDASLALRFPTETGFLDAAGAFVLNEKGVPGAETSLAAALRTPP